MGVERGRKGRCFGIESSWAGSVGVEGVRRVWSRREERWLLGWSAGSVGSNERGFWFGVLVNHDV